MLTNLSAGLTHHYIRRYPYIHLSEELELYPPSALKVQRRLTVLPKHTTQCFRPGLEPGPLDPESSVLTVTRPSRLSNQLIRNYKKTVEFKEQLPDPKCQPLDIH